MPDQGSSWSIECQPELGGRLSSLRDPAGREWLWRNADQSVVAARAGVSPGDSFVDAGGWEECFPTIGGSSDHGEVWSRSWSERAGEVSITTEDYRLSRKIQPEGPHLIARYRLRAAPGTRFVWTAHLLLDLSANARLDAPAESRCRLWPDHWLASGPVAPVEGSWPDPLGAPLDRLAPDGSALFFMLLAPKSLTVADGSAITFSLDAPGQPTAIAIWRNLGGWPPDAPYRSIGIEPAIGHHYDRDLASPGELGTVGPSGTLNWTLTISVGER